MVMSAQMFRCGSRSSGDFFLRHKIFTAGKADLKITCLFLPLFSPPPLVWSRGRTFSFSIPEHGLWVGNLLDLSRFFSVPLLANFPDNWSRMQTEWEKGGFGLGAKAWQSVSALCNGCAHPLSIPPCNRFHKPPPPALPEEGLSSVIKYPWSGRNQLWMFITLGQRVLMEKLLQSMSSPQGNRIVDRKQQYFFILSLRLLLCFLFTQTGAGRVTPDQKAYNGP